MTETRNENGEIRAIKYPTELKSGTGKKGKWTLWTAGLRLGGEWHNATSFSKKELEELVSGLSIGDYVKIADEKNDKGFWQISNVVKIKKEAEEIPEPSDDEIAAAHDDPLDRYAQVYAKCKTKIEQIYGVRIDKEDEGYQKELIAAVNTMFIQMVREMKW